MKYFWIDVVDGDTVYLIIYGKIEEARVITQIAGKSFLVLILSSSEQVKVEYGNEMFLTRKKANIEYRNRLKDAETLEKAIYPPSTRSTRPTYGTTGVTYRICDICGAVSNSGRTCECRYGQ